MQTTTPAGDYTQTSANYCGSHVVCYEGMVGHPLLLTGPAPSVGCGCCCRRIEGGAVLDRPSRFVFKRRGEGWGREQEM